ncbi:aspartate/glutamate racemase family protein [Geomonas propionica]|uniref:Aspartate/glutamate racemase family protein n=1 Tax=Geomonas propionica TaxID=2798582 RepID=A0ABS0YPD2_9BACT|nr:aspartate/glutamate racemase family protein [Geomonas propionica]MBJ6799779.1 aspartate/glutamate racemase family protein [Geomonas propionica]
MKITLTRCCSFLVFLMMIASGFSTAYAQDVQKNGSEKQNTPAATASEKRPIKTIGIVGGVSWASSIEYYRIMNEQVRDRLGGVSSAQLLMYSIEFGEFSKQEKMADKGDWTLMTKTIVDAAQRLKRGGADFIVIASNTLNSLAGTVEQQVGLPVLHIADATGKAVAKKGVRTVALLGTTYTMEQPFYRDRLTKYGIKVVIPSKKERDYINTVIFDELCANKVQRESREGFKKIIDRLRKEDGAEGVVLGCTEIPLLIKQEDVSIPVFDTTQIHSEAAVEYSLNGE